jgi:hypothetical protein
MTKKKHFFHGRHLVLHVAKTVYESAQKTQGIGAGFIFLSHAVCEL